MTTSIGVAQLLAVFFGCIFFGLDLVTTGICLRVLFDDSQKHGRYSILHRVYIFCVLFMLCDAIFLVVLQFVLALRIFIDYNGTGGPTAALLGPASKLGQLQDFPYGLQTVIGDALFIHRAYTVYERDWRVLAFFIPPYLVVSNSHHVAITATGADALSPFLTPALVCSFAINVAATSLIVRKIVKVLQSTRSHDTGEALEAARAGARRRFFHRVLRIAVESGALYSTSVLAFIVTFLARDPISHVFSGIVVMNIAIAFNLIIIRVHQGRTMDAHVDNDTRPVSTIVFEGANGRTATIHSLGRAAECAEGEDSEHLKTATGSSKSTAQETYDFLLYFRKDFAKFKCTKYAQVWKPSSILTKTCRSIVAPDYACVLNGADNVGSTELTAMAVLNVEIAQLRAAGGFAEVASQSPRPNQASS
ncbi:hypothetical protein K488DRAFT_71753 [Vararia minispora EC-137]|uniref:Uncharacterized protein n=1 Tax=Vararia minispora EC-137 TaxID=1314806 RepID=A0ACB8QGW6_9AGAM|nr:hypothetical protein K488DRAFT_71753 [Vararia minispora EC-137]